jgi:hypothetical protein
VPANVFEWDGWQGQFCRARRWLDHLIVVANDWETYSLDEQIDFALAFFQNVYYLRDYLLREEVVAQKALDELMIQTTALRIARDLTNGSKHRFVTRPSVDASPWILRSLNFDRTPRLTLKAGAELLDLVAVACACLDAWRAFFREHRLEPASLSPARSALVEAVRGNFDA